MELKDITEALGYKADQFKTVEEFKSEFEKSFIRTSLISEDNEFVKPIIGKIFGTIENDLKVIAKKQDLEIDFNDADFKDKKFKHKVDFFATKLNEKNKSIIDDLTVKAGQGNDEKVKEYEVKLTKAQQKAKDFEALLSATTNEYNQFKEKATSDIKGVKLNILTKDAFSKLKLKPEITEIEKRGFNSYIAESYNFDVDENESLIVTDKKGNKIPSTKVVGTFKSIDEILEEEAVKNKVFALNPNAGTPKPNAVTPQKQNTTPATPSAFPQRSIAKKM